jgi:uncharacterized protein YecE (DUF72 family)
MANTRLQKTISHPPAVSPEPARILVGTSGYSYTEWVEAGFYPPGTQPGRMLHLYAQRFPITELTRTWHQMPQADAIERLRQAVPTEFQFIAKLFRGLTHEPLADNWRDMVTAFRHGVAPLIQSGQLTAVLLQFPPEFDRCIANRRHLAALIDEMEDLPLAVEFRQGSWNNERVFVELERRGITLVAVDEPELPGLFPALDVVTNPDLFYIRFHGRNIRGWRKGLQPLQFDYNYFEGELREWVETRVITMSVRAGRGVAMFNNHVRAQAPQNAEIFLHLLKEYGLVQSVG